jgi:hypothetical protein
MQTLKIIWAVISIFLSIGLIFINSGATYNVVIPTPFYKRLFEFTVGFRKTFIAVIFAYTLAIVAVLASNFNVGAFAVIILIFTICSFFIQTENEFYVWIFNKSPEKFILMKIKDAIINSSILSAPLLFILGFFFREEILLLSGIWAFSFIVYSVIIVAKYSSYPEKIGIMQGVILVLTIQLPPLILLTLPYFYFKSLKNLKLLLQ